MVFALYWAWGVSKKKSQYPADGAEYCDFTFLLYKSFLFSCVPCGGFFCFRIYGTSFSMPWQHGRDPSREGSRIPPNRCEHFGLLDNNLDNVVVNLHKL